MKIIASMLGLSLSVCAALFGCDPPAAEPRREPQAVPKPAVTSASSTVTSANSSAGAAMSAAVRAPEEPLKSGELAAPGDVAKAPADAKKEKSGLTTKVLQPGSGKDHPGVNDTVKVHYSGWTTDGHMFDSSVARGAPAEFEVSGVIKGWTEGLQLMVTGEKRRMWIPAELAYGRQQTQMGAPVGDLTFDVELLELHKAPEPPPVPNDLAKPPADAKKTTSRLVYRFLVKGKGKKHPKPTDTVKVHYSGWTKDGKMFDSSVVRGKPASFAVNEVIKGWTEGLQLMVEGDKCRLWIPADLAYGDKPRRPGAPAGDLVFDVELLGI